MHGIVEVIPFFFPFFLIKNSEYYIGFNNNNNNHCDAIFFHNLRILVIFRTKTKAKLHNMENKG